MIQNSYTTINIDPQQPTTSVPQTNGQISLQNDKKIASLQAQVNEVSSIMEENIKRIVERGARLENIENRSDQMMSRADEFRVNAKRVKNQAWWHNQRMNLFFLILLVAVCAIVYFTAFRG